MNPRCFIRKKLDEVSHLLLLKIIFLSNLNFKLIREVSKKLTKSKQMAFAQSNFNSKYSVI